MTDVCPDCGARAPDTVTCQERFDRALAMELEDHAYYAVHHLLVPSFMLQHNGYSRPGWFYTRELLAELVEDGLTPEAARRRDRRRLDSGNRTWSLTRGPKFERFGDIVWTMTIADVRFDTADHYCADVRTWAEAVLADSARVIG